MNIVIHRYNSICEPDFIESFKAFGLDVIEDDAEITDKNIPIEKRIQTLSEMILINKPLFVFSINFFPYISMICEKLGYKYVCVSVDCPVSELFANMIRNKCNRVFLFDYQQYLDVHDENPEGIFYMPLGVNVDRINRTIGEPGFNNTDHTEDTFNLKEADISDGSTDSNKKRGQLSAESIYKYDISFIGSLYNEKNKYAEIYGKLPEKYRGLCDGYLAAQELLPGQELLENVVTDDVVEAIKKADPNFYSSEHSYKNIDKFVAINGYLSVELTVRDRLNLMYTMSNALKDIGQVHLFTRSDLTELKEAKAPIIYHGGVRTMDEMPLVFRQSKINLNPTMRPIRSGLPQRIWDVLGCGGFLLTNYQQEIPEYFEVGKHLEAYETIEEACEKAAYYLAHEDERLEIAKNGYELVKERHKISDRVAEIIKAIV